MALRRRAETFHTLGNATFMSSTLYLTIMLSIIGLLMAVIIPALFLKKCESCGARTIIDARTCSRCGTDFPEQDRSASAD